MAEPIEADQKFKLFDARFGPGEVASNVLRAQESVSAVLTLAGLDDPSRAVGSYARQVFRQTLEQAPKALISAPHGVDRFARIRDFLVLNGKLRFADLDAIKLTAIGLLAPWRPATSQPPDVFRAATQGFLLDHLRDPRTHPKNWPARDSFEVKLMLRWLARASFRAFFDLIQETSADPRFEERRAFWAAYLERDHVDDVWLALGSQIHSSARAVRELNGAFARLKGAGGSDAILLLEMKNIVLCEWSVVGRLRAWPGDWKNAPRLGHENYVREDVKGRGLPFPTTAKNSTGAPDGNGLVHAGGEVGRWQSSAAELIRRKTGIALGPEHWMPE